MRANLLAMYTRACAVSNTGRPLTDNTEGHAVAEIEALRNVEVHAGLVLYSLKEVELHLPQQDALDNLQAALDKVRILE